MPLVPRFQRVRWLRRLTVVTAGAMVVGFPALAVGGAPTASPTPSECIGDCDNMGQVTVNEILELVNIALGLDATSTCAAGDANHDGVITVDEILKAVNIALTRCLLTGSAGSEAASGAADSTQDAADSGNRIVGFGKAGTGGGSAAAETGGAAAFPNCPAGGNVDIVSCDSHLGTSVLIAMLVECSDVDPQTQAKTIRTGTLKLTVADPGVCANLQIPPDVLIMSEFTQFTVARLDAAGQTITQINRLTDVFMPSGQGCDGPNGRDSLRGAITVHRSQGGTVERVASYTYTDFVIDTASVPSTAACIAQQTVNGALTVDDSATGRHFFETARNFVITSHQSDNIHVLTENGTLTLDCLGAAGFSTVEPLRIAPPVSCPFAGVVDVRLPDGSVSRTRFTPDGVAFDFNSDGKIDKQVASCVDPTLAQCTDAASVP
jgi:hypothetical protein